MVWHGCPLLWVENKFFDRHFLRCIHRSGWNLAKICCRSCAFNLTPIGARQWSFRKIGTMWTLQWRDQEERPRERDVTIINRIWNSNVDPSQSLERSEPECWGISRTWLCSTLTENASYTCVRNAIIALYHNTIFTNAHNKQKLRRGDIDNSVPSTPNYGDLHPRDRHPW